MTSSPYGFKLHAGDGGDRFEMRCPHQNGLLYMVPADKSWVCSDEHRHAHVLAGFFKDLAALESREIRDVMNRWGLFYRERPLEEAAAEDGSSRDGRPGTG